MLEALTVLLRARRRTFDHDRGPLGLILAEHLVMSDVDDLVRRVVAVDPMVVRELLDEVTGQGPVEVRAVIEGDYVMLSAPVAADCPRSREGRSSRWCPRFRRTPGAQWNASLPCRYSSTAKARRFRSRPNVW